MSRAVFHFYDELNTFLPRRQKYLPLVHQFDWRASVKDMVESLGVPHCEVELMVVNGTPVDFSYIVQDQDQIHVYPNFDAVEVNGKIRLRLPLVPKEVRFVLDAHLGRLSSYLRMMGFDTLYRNDYDDEELAEIAHHENRILLTRDVGLLKRSLVTYGYFVRELHAKPRLKEVIQRFDLAAHVSPFKHCMKCNGILEAVDKKDILDRLPADTGGFYHEFHRCGSCRQIYWKGPHYERMVTIIDDVLRELGDTPAKDQSA